MMQHTAGGLAFSFALYLFADSDDKSVKFGALSMSLSSYFLQMSLLNCDTHSLRHYHNTTAVYGTLTQSTMNKLSWRKPVQTKHLDPFFSHAYQSALLQNVTEYEGFWNTVEEALQALWQPILQNIVHL